jgi:hypothetical protein
MSASKVLTITAIAEALTGLALLFAPSLVVELLLGTQATGIATPIARFAGIALIGLGVACWPGPPIAGMATYGMLVTLYLAYFGFTAPNYGILLWPAVALHAILATLLIWLIAKPRSAA